jgi:flagellar basal-body rod protein FlgB
MAITNIALFSMLRSRMHWSQERQQLLAENVANADTPSFRPRDLAPLQLDRPLNGLNHVQLARTEPGHIAGIADDSSRFGPARAGRYDVRPTGNAVNLEDEMIKVAANQMDFQQVATLYTRSLGLIKTAVRRR